MKSIKRFWWSELKECVALDSLIRNFNKMTFAFLLCSFCRLIRFRVKVITDPNAQGKRHTHAHILSFNVSVCVCVCSAAQVCCVSLVNLDVCAFRAYLCLSLPNRCSFQVTIHAETNCSLCTFHSFILVTGWPTMVNTVLLCFTHKGERKNTYV